MIDADIRPTFAELSREFEKMSHEPSKYLVIQVTYIYHIYYMASLVQLFTVRMSRHIRSTEFTMRVLMCSRCEDLGELGSLRFMDRFHTF
jgi:hypothetical protein